MEKSGHRSLLFALARMYLPAYIDFWLGTRSEFQLVFRGLIKRKMRMKIWNVLCGLTSMYWGTASK